MAAIALCRDVGFQSIADGAVGMSWTWGVIRFDSHATGQAQIHQLCGIPPAMQILGAAGFPITDLTLSTPGVTITVASGDDAPPAKRARVLPAPRSPKLDLRWHAPRSLEQSVRLLAVAEQGALEQSAHVTQAVVPALQATVPTAEAYPQPHTTYNTQPAAGEDNNSVPLTTE
jgi:hypothetical protein